MIAVLKRQMTFFFFSGMGIVSFNFAALTVTTGNELPWCSFSFTFISISTALLCSRRCQGNEFGIFKSLLFPLF